MDFSASVSKGDLRVTLIGLCNRFYHFKMGFCIYQVGVFIS